MRLNEIAAEIHRRMCEDDRFGYSWEERYGAVWEAWTIDGKGYRIRVDDYDCSRPHGFPALSETAGLCYNCDDVYHPNDEGD